ncbi:MAG TPA: Wzz/FepE/Etk N-terminal domain-containing protein [Pyrinomonadaceae bacterium]|nr:Wzz/FepE/Etk N-terminal domain-containing protein [Pyrinomonadaceae bacterium]
MNSHKGMAGPLKIIWNRRWVILITTTAVMAATLWWTNGLPQVYEASVVLGSTKDNGGSQQQLLANAREHLNDRQTLEALIQSDAFRDQRTAGISGDRLAENIRQSTNISNEPRADGFAIRVKYRDRTPERAQLIAGALSQVIEKSYRGDGQGEGLRVEQPATLAAGPIMPRRLRLTGIGIGAGILAGLVLAGIAEIASRFRNSKIDPQPAR